MASKSPSWDETGVVTVNVNKLYGETAPHPDNMDEYFKKLQNQMPSAEKLKDLSVLLSGTGPVWLFTEIVLFLKPFCAEIWLKNKGGVTRVGSASEQGFSVGKKQRQLH